jgi:tetratricopeptide (TPR) repeat protein
MSARIVRTFVAVLVCVTSEATLFARRTASKASRPSASPAQAQKTPASSPDYSKEAAVIEQIREQHWYENDGSSREVQYVRVRIQAEAAVQAWGQLVASYDASTDKIHIDFVRVHKPDGRVVNAGPDAIKDLSSPVERVAPVYTDIRQVHITVPSLSVGDTLEYQLTTQTVHPLIPGQFFLEWNFSKQTITLDESLTVNLPRDRKTKVRTVNGFAAPQIRDQGDRRIYSWHSSFTQRPADSTGKSGSKKKSEPAKFPDVALSTFENWEQVGRWYASLEKPRAAVSDAIRTEAAALVKGQTTDLGKVKAIYDYFAENIRYVSLSFGVGRYQPHLAQEVLASQYGDCKDMATLFQALLAAEGITSYPAMISSGSKIDPDVPSPGQFDHVINVVLVDGKPYWADTTPGSTPFGFLVQSLRDKWALAVSSSKPPSLVRTPENPPFIPVHSFDIEGKIGPLGQLQGHYSLSFSGSAAAEIRDALEQVPESEWRRLAQALVTSMFSKDSTAGDFHFSAPADLSQPLKFDTEYTEPGALDPSQKQVSLPLSGNGFGLPAVDRPGAGSTNPLDLGEIRDDTNRWKFELPPKYHVDLPVPVHVVRDYGEYESSYSLSGSTVTVVRHLILRKAKLPPELYHDYQAFHTTVDNDSNQQVVLTSSAPGYSSKLDGMSAEDLYNAGYKLADEGNFDEAARFLAAAAAKDPNIKNVWTVLGYVYMNDSQDKKAVDAFKTAIAKNPYDTEVHLNLGIAYEHLNRNDDALKEFQKQIEINPLKRDTYSDIAYLYLWMKKYGQAVDAFHTALKFNSDDFSLYVGLGETELGLHQDAAALQSFNTYLAHKPNSTAWNWVAYVLSEHGSHLDKAEDLSQDSIRAMEAQLNAISLDTIDKVSVGRASGIISFWDTMGWIKFQQGDLEAAERYLHPAWVFRDDGVIGDHLGQVYEKEHRRADAIRTFALVLLTSNAPFKTRDRLAALVGKGKVDSEIDAARKDFIAQRTVDLPNAQHLKGAAQFWVLFSSGPKANRSKETAAHAVDVKFISGDAPLGGYADALRHARFPFSFAPGGRTKLVIRGKLTCSSQNSSCAFNIFLPSDTYRMTPASGSDTEQ